MFVTVCFICKTEDFQKVGGVLYLTLSLVCIASNFMAFNAARDVNVKSLL